jgi:hypothetical protein
MKHLFFMVLLGLTVFSCSHAQEGWQPIGELQDGKEVLTADKAELLRAYNQNLQRFSVVNGEFTEVRIETGAQGAYALVFSSKACKSTLLVEQADDGTVMRANGTISCNTADCTHENGI